MESDKIKINTVIISILAVIAIEIMARFVVRQNFVAPLISLGLARLCQIIFLLFLVNIYEKGFSAIGLNFIDPYKGLKKGFIWAVVFGVAGGVVLFIVYLGGIHVSALFKIKLPDNTMNLYFFFLIGAFLAPLAEELFFRGILYGFFRRWGILTAIILSTLLFVMPHTSGHTLPITQIIGGILFAVSYEVEKNLLVPITIHSLGNLAIFTIAVFI